MESGQPLPHLSWTAGDALGVVLSADGSSIATISYHQQLEENVAMAYMASQSGTTVQYATTGPYIHTDVLAVALNAHGDVLAAGGMGRRADIFALRRRSDTPPGGSPAVREPLAALSTQEWVTGLALNEDGTRVAVATSNQIEIWDYAAKQVVAVMDHGNARILAFTDADRRLVSVGEDRALVWELTYGRELEERLQATSQPLADHEELLRQIPGVCRRVGRSLTPEEWAAYFGPDEPYSQTCTEPSPSSSSG
jgi:WD40 repeat protein